MRRGIVDFIRDLTGVPGIADLCMTTNGVALADLAADQVTGAAVLVP